MITYFKKKYVSYSLILSMSISKYINFIKLLFVLDKLH